MDFVKTLVQTYLDDNGADEPAREPASLFECPACKAVFIGVEKRACLSCDQTVDPISNERELGLV